MLNNALVVISLMALISLIATVVLYMLFDNYAIFENAKHGIKLGGSVAFFFILFTTEFFIYKNINYDRLAPIRKAISGEWIGNTEFKNKATGKKNIYKSRTTIQVGKEGRIILTGNIDGMAETWEADEVVLTDSKLVYFFEIPMWKISGVGNLRFTYNDEPQLSEMNGYWILAGQQGKGSVTFKRASD